MDLPDPNTLGLTTSEEEQIKNRWDTISVVLKRLAAKGLFIPEQPPPFPIPEVSTTLVDTNNQEYLKTNAKYLAWLNFVLPHIALNEAVILQVRNEKSNIEEMYRDQARRNNEGVKGTARQSKEEIEDNTHLDPRYIELTQFEQELLQEKSLLETKKDELGRVLRVISRHVEVKKLDVEMNRTGANLPQRRPFNSGGRG